MRRRRMCVTSTRSAAQRLAWKAKSDRLSVWPVRKLKVLEDGSAQLKWLSADAMLK